MLINKVFIKNFKSLRNFDLDFNNDLNIIVGNNEAGKSTVLEAINLALTHQINGRNVIYELSPHLFNKATVDEFLTKLRRGENIEPPKILIEVYLNEVPELTKLKGTNNSKKENAVGLFILIQFNDEFADEYQTYIKDPGEVKTLPTEYYEVKWYSFAHNAITTRGLPIKTTLIDTTSVKLQNGTDYYVNKTIDDLFEKKERAGLSLLYRKLKESFADLDLIKTINARLKSEKNVSSAKDLSISLDISQKSNWDSQLTSYLNEIPFNYIGKGDQSTLKMLLALERPKSKEAHVVLIEEPENHLSFSRMNELINTIAEKCIGKQLIITTHSAFVLNKLGLEKLILIGENLSKLTLNELSPETQNHFKKLPGYDTLRLILAKKTILVEGPSDELIVQKAYFQSHNKLPIDDGIDVIALRGLSFERYLEIAKILQKQVRVITDNDGSCQKLNDKYEKYASVSCIKICYDHDENYKTLEPQIVKANTLEVLNESLSKKYLNKDDLQHYMECNKTEVALKIFETDSDIIIPQYIHDAFK